MKCQSFFLVFVIAFFSCKNNRFQIANDDTFVTNGAILTVNERFQIAESMVIRGSEIVYVGKPWITNIMISKMSSISKAKR